MGELNFFVLSELSICWLATLGEMFLELPNRAIGSFDLYMQS